MQVDADKSAQQAKCKGKLVMFTPRLHITLASALKLAGKKCDNI